MQDICAVSKTLTKSIFCPDFRHSFAHCLLFIFVEDFIKSKKR